MAWLFLLSYWVLAVVVACFFYAWWNRGVDGSIELAGVQHVKGFGADTLPDAIPPATPFEWDRLFVELRFDAARPPKGPARTTARIGRSSVDVGAGLVPRAGHSRTVELERQGRGPVVIRDWVHEEGDPLGLFRRRWVADGIELTVLLPQFASLRQTPTVREHEAMTTAPRAGHGTEIFGVREYRPGDTLRRIHWRSTARRGELVVREFEPPGVQNLGVFLDPNPASAEVADQVARLAASEAWDCLRTGGRVTLWAPGCEPSRPDEERNLLALLDWLARYPNRSDQAPGEPPRVGDAIAVTGAADPRLMDAVEDVRHHGGDVRAWVVGDAALDADIEVERAGTDWPLRP